jgi:hypothetical protein
LSERQKALESAREIRLFFQLKLSEMRSAQCPTPFESNPRHIPTAQSHEKPLLDEWRGHGLCAFRRNGNDHPCLLRTGRRVDHATDPTYAGGWSAGQNGGSGFGAWSFTGTDPAGTQHEMSSALPVGTAWTLFNSSSTIGISIAGRAIPGGLQPSQTFETLSKTLPPIIFFRGFDLGFLNATDNHLAGNNSASLSLNVFGYTFTGFLPNWSVNDAGGSTTSSLSPYTSAAAGLKLDLTLISATTYALTLTPLSNPAAAYSQNGTLSGPIDWVQFRLHNTASSGPGDTADNFGISYMTIIPEPSTFALIGLGFGGLLFLRRRK